MILLVLLITGFVCYAGLLFYMGAAGLLAMFGRKPKAVVSPPAPPPPSHNLLIPVGDSQRPRRKKK